MSLITSVLTGGPSNHTTSSEEVNAYATDFVSQGIVGSFSNTGGVAPATGAFAVNAQGTPDMTVAVSSGVAYVTAVPSSQNSQKLRVRNTASSNVTISANASGSTKYDWVYIKIDATNANAPNTAGDNVATLVTSRSSSASTDDGTPPTYGYCIAVVTVANGASSITNANIRDVRNLAVISATSTGQSQDWYASGYVPSSITANGNRSYTCVVNSADLTSFLSKGMRLRFTRTTPSPTQCTSLNGTNQYWSKTTPSGMTFTDDFVVSAWIKLASYPSGLGVIASRQNGTSGWLFYVNSDGTINLRGYNAGGGNLSGVASYQSVPLNKWVHVVAQLDMSSFTATPTTSYVMLDGVDVPASVTRAGTNPTSLVQAGNLEIGSYNGGTSPLTGKIAQVAIYNAKVTQANIRATISQGLLGTETSLISAFSFNNSSTDLGSNGNTLSANNSAAATNSDSPFSVPASGTPGGTYDYGIVQDISFSTNSTITVQVPEGCTIPTTGGVSAMAYSGFKVPYGMPTDSDKWSVTAVAIAQIYRDPTSTVLYAYTRFKVNAPIGAWDTSVVANGGTSNNAASAIDQRWALYPSTTDTIASATVEAAVAPGLHARFSEGWSSTYLERQFNLQASVNLSAATDYSLYFLCSASGILSGGLRAVGPSIIRFKCAYL